MKLIIFYLFLIFTILAPLPCYSKCDPSLIREAVMKEGMSIKLHTQFGVIAILAGKGCERTFTWDNQSYTVELIPRLKRWYGKLGLYHPQMRPPHENVVHIATTVSGLQVGKLMLSFPYAT